MSPLTTTIPLVGLVSYNPSGSFQGIDDTPLLSLSPSSPLFCVSKATTLGTGFDLASPSRGVRQLATPGPQNPQPRCLATPLITPWSITRHHHQHPTPLCHRLPPWRLGITLLATASSSKGTAHLHTRYTAIDYPPASVSCCLRHATLALGPPLPIHPPALWDPAHLPGFSQHPSPSVTLHQLHMAPQASRPMGPCHKWASHACKPSFISIDPSPLPTPCGLGHGSRGTFAFGLEGLQLWPMDLPFPPPS